MKLSAKVVRFDDDSLWGDLRRSHDRGSLRLVPPVAQRQSETALGDRNRSLWAALGGDRREHFDRRAVGRAKRSDRESRCDRIREAAKARLIRALWCHDRERRAELLSLRSASGRRQAPADAPLLGAKTFRELRR